MKEFREASQSKVRRVQCGSSAAPCPRPLASRAAAAGARLTQPRVLPKHRAHARARTRTSSSPCRTTCTSGRRTCRGPRARPSRAAAFRSFSTSRCLPTVPRQRPPRAATVNAVPGQRRQVQFCEAAVALPVTPHPSPAPALQETYPLQAPKARFMTRIFHPNIHFKTGEVLPCCHVPAWSRWRECVRK